MRIPVIASLNGTTPGGWLSYARLIEQAGADALELNVFHIATDPDTKQRRDRAGDDRDGPAGQAARQDSGRRQAFAILYLVRPSSRSSSIGKAPMAWCCSTASMRPTSMWRI